MLIIIGETGGGVYGNSLYYLCNCFVNFKLILNRNRRLYWLKPVVSTVFKKIQGPEALQGLSPGGLSTCFSIIKIKCKKRCFLLIIGWKAWSLCRCIIQLLSTWNRAGLNWDVLWCKTHPGFLRRKKRMHDTFIIILILCWNDNILDMLG